MTGQQLIEQGRQEGFLQGFLQGMLLRLLRERFGAAVTPQIEQRVQAGSSEQLEAWLARFAAGGDLAEMFAE